MNIIYMIYVCFLYIESQSVERHAVDLLCTKHIMKQNLQSQYWNPYWYYVSTKAHLISIGPHTSAILLLCLYVWTGASLVSLSVSMPPGIVYWFGMVCCTLVGIALVCPVQGLDRCTDTQYLSHTK